MVKIEQYLLDSGIFIRFYRKDKRAAGFLQKFLEQNYGSVLALTEVLVGFRDEITKEKARKFLQRFRRLQVDVRVAELAADLIQSKQ